METGISPMTRQRRLFAGLMAYVAFAIAFGYFFGDAIRDIAGDGGAAGAGFVLLAAGMWLVSRLA